MTPERRHDRFRVSPGPGLGGRVSRAVALGAGFALLASGLILDAFVYVSLRATLVDDFTIQARITAESSSAAIVFRDAPAATQILAAMQVSPSVEHAELRDLDGGLVAQYTRAGSAERPEGNLLVLPVEGHRFADGRLHLSQAVLASVLNTSTSTVRKWEVGDKRPSGPSQKLLDIIERKGLEAVL
jgi:hypothetical protein